MKKTTKVTLSSLLIFPGLGHVLLKKYPLALAFILSFSYLLFGIVNTIIEKSQVIVDGIINGSIPLEINAINEALAQQGVIGSQYQTTAGCLLLIIWLLAAFDAYRIAKKDSACLSLDAD